MCNWRTDLQPEIRADLASRLAISVAARLCSSPVYGRDSESLGSGTRGIVELMDDAKDAVEHHPAGGSHIEGGVVEHPSADHFGNAAALPADPTWFKHAVFYEVLVRAFFDASADGSGDLRGLIDRLDYLQWLGIDCIWLPPFYDSPLRDGGYDIRDFYKVLSEFGTVDDFVALVDAAHQRGIRVITDLVMNHTSESHPWFQESRRDPDGPYGDYYVWSDTSEKYTDDRIIFVDSEESNSTFDPVRPRAGSELLQPGRAGGDDRRSTLLARPGYRRVSSVCGALPLRARGHQLQEPARDTRLPQARPQGGRRRVPGPGAAGRGQSVAGRCRRVLRRRQHRRRRVPHGVSLPADASHLHGGSPGVAVSDLGDHGPDTADPGYGSVGDLSA